MTRFLWLLMALTLGGCGGPRQQGKDGQLFDYKGQGTKATKPPTWVRQVSLDGDRLCGIGVAGAGYNADSPYPRQLSEERAIHNLAGVLGTRVQEAIIDRETTRSLSVRTARALTVDDTLVERVRSLAETEFWLDVAGKGPYASKNFTYAHTCIDATAAAATFKVDPSTLKKGSGNGAVNPKKVPAWISEGGLRDGERLCAVGFSLPTFHPDKTFQVVVEDIRSQLAEVIQTLVSSYYEELTTNRGQAIEVMNVATTEAISKGAIVTHYWYDRDGIGPFRKTRTTYGYGCVYPVDIVMSSVAAAEEQAPEDEKDVIRKVRERARDAFADLEAEIEKRETEPVDVPQDPPESSRDQTLPSPETAPATRDDSVFATPPQREQQPAPEAAPEDPGEP